MVRTLKVGQESSVCSVILLRQIRGSVRLVGFGFEALRVALVNRAVSVVVVAISVFSLSLSLFTLVLTFSVQIAVSSISLTAVIGIAVYLRTRTGLNTRMEVSRPKLPGGPTDLG
jgi:hypothetical protein